MKSRGITHYNVTTYILSVYVCMVMLELVDADLNIMVLHYFSQV